MPKKNEKNFETLATDYADYLDPNKMTVEFARNEWNRVHGDNKSMTGGLIHSETMDSQKHGLLARMLYYNRPKFQEPVTLSEDETEQNANVITSLRTGLKNFFGK